MKMRIKKEKQVPFWGAVKAQQNKVEIFKLPKMSTRDIHGSFHIVFNVNHEFVLFLKEYAFFYHLRVHVFHVPVDFGTCLYKRFFLSVYDNLCSI